MTATFWERNERELIKRFDFRPASGGREMVSNECPFHGAGNNPHLAVNPDKGVFHCVQCEVSGPVEGLALDLVLAERGLTEATIAHFGIEVDAEINAVRYPVKHEGIAKDRFKAVPNAKGSKTWWPRDGKKTPPLYNGASISGPEVWIVEGEPDVWIMHQAGLTNVVSSTHGAGTFKREAIEFLVRRGVNTARIVYDRDDEGRNGARKLAVRLAAKGIVATVVEVTESLGDGGDVTDLYLSVGGDDAAFRAALKALAEEARKRAVAARTAPAKVGGPTAAWRPLVSDDILKRIDPSAADREIERFVADAAVATDASLDYLRASYLSALSTILGPHHRLLPRVGAPGGVHISLFVLLMGISTYSRKSTAMRFARELVQASDAGAVLANNFSPEALLADVAERDGQGCIAFLDEFVGLVKQTHRRSGFQAHAPETLMQLGDGGPQSVSRRDGKPRLEIHDPFLNILAATTPAALEDAGRVEDILMGFLPRFWIVASGKRRPRLPIRDLTADETKRLEAALGRMKRLAAGLPGPIGGQPLASSRRRTAWTLSPWAASLLDRYDVELERRAAEHDALAAYFGRMLWVTARIAVVLAAERLPIAQPKARPTTVITVRFEPGSTVARKGDPSQSFLRSSVGAIPIKHPVLGALEVPGEDMAYAIWLMERTMPEAVELLRAIGRSPFERKLDQVARAVARGGSSGVRRNKIVTNQKIRTKEMDEIEGALVERGLIRIDISGGSVRYYPVT